MADDDTATPPVEETKTAEPAKKDNHLLQTPADGPDPDEVELQSALDEVKAEESQVTPKADEPAATTPPAKTAEEIAAQPAATTHEHGTHVPIAVVQDERSKRQTAEADLRKVTANALYWEKVAKGELPDPRRTETAPGRIPEIKAKMKDLGKQVDAGTLSIEQYEDQRQALDDELYQIRETQTLEKVKEQTPKPNDLYLDTVTAGLESENAWIHNVPVDEIEALIPFARKDLHNAGVNMALINGTPLGDYRLREAIVARAKIFGFDKTYGATTPAAETPKPDLSNTRPSTDQIKAKEDLAAKAPPPQSTTSAPQNAFTPERIEAMDSVDLENLPMSELRKLGDNLDRSVAAHRTAGASRR